MFKKLWRLVRKIGSKISNVLSDFWKKGVKEDLAGGRKVKSTLDLCLAGGLIFAIIIYPASIVLASIATIITGWFLSRIFQVRSSLSGDIVNIFLQIGCYAFSFYLWTFVREIVLLLILFTIPRLTKDVEDQADVYYDELTPEAV